MSTPITFNNVAYSVPAYNDTGYAQGAGNLSAYLIAIATGTLQPSGGTFALTADVNFGTNFGLVALYYKSTTANIATAGSIRLARTDVIDWRNQANSANLVLGVSSSNNLQWQGADVLTGSSGGFVSSITGTANQIIASSPTGAVTLSTPQDIGPASSVTFGQIIDAGLTANTVPYSNGSKQFTSSAVTPTELGYVSGVTSSIQTQLNGKQPSGTYITSITGTANQIIVGGTATVPILSTPQDIATTSNVQFNHLLISGNASAGAGITVTDTNNGTTSLISLTGSATPSITFSPNGAASSFKLVTSALPASLRTITIPDPGVAAADIILSQSAQTLNGIKTFGTPIAVGSGGTGVGTFTAYSVICAGTTATGNFQNVSGVGSSGQVLTSNGAAALPTWQNVAGGGTVNSGTATHLAYYATSTNAVSDASGATISGNYTFSGVPTFSNEVLFTGNSSGVVWDSTQSFAGDLQFNFANTSTNAAASASGRFQVDSAAGGDAFVLVGILSSNVWSSGLDNSDSDKFKITTGASPSAGTVSLVASHTTGAVSILGTATNDSTTAGYVGEVIQASTLRSVNISLTTNTTVNVASVSLTAGDWDVRGLVGYSLSGGTTATSFINAISTTSATLPAADTLAVPDSAGQVTVQENSATTLVTGAGDYILSIPPSRVSIASTTTYYLVARSTFAVSGNGAYGSIVARRMR